jgi:hypothetical protein
MCKKFPGYVTENLGDGYVVNTPKKKEIVGSNPQLYIYFEIMFTSALLTDQFSLWRTNIWVGRIGGRNIQLLLTNKSLGCFLAGHVILQ